MIHPALRLSVLYKLPFHAQRTALAAACGSEEDFRAIQRLVRNIPWNDRHKSRLFLPVFYANLDEAKIPIGDGLDDPSIFTAGPVYLAMTSLQEIHSMALLIPLPSGIFSHLWPRLWKWLEFFDSYRLADDEAGPGVGFVKFISLFFAEKSSGTILTSTPGFRRMVARSWIILLQTANPAVACGFDGLTIILESQVVVTSLADVEEIIDGAGGSIDDLASLIVGYVDRIAQDNFGLEGEIFNFIENIETSLGFKRPKGPKDPKIGPLCIALCSTGIVKSLTRMVHSLMRTNGSAYTTHIPHLIPKAVHLLITLFLTASGSRMIPDALRHGLLYVVVSCSAVNQFNDDLTMLVKVLSCSLVSYATLLVLEDSLATVKEFATSSRFLSSTVFKHWKTFTELSAERLALLRKFNETAQKRRKACDNVQCGKIGDRSLFRRCSICKGCYYCSSQCQEADWLAGEHGKFCQPYPCFRLSEMQPVGVRERAFMRTLLNHDYTEMRLAVYTKQAIFMAQNPATPFFTLFQSSRGRFEIMVHPLTIAQLRVLWPDYDDRSLGGLHNDLVRAARSAHRMDLHVLGMSEGLDERFFLVPFRSGNIVRARRAHADRPTAWRT
ncbi:hypothetical protein MVEN_01134600 [Mycena venus]|uniref:MYND-type domain-containing protein n=1 Tax=Mycena venus TaxID=2733690 RepID=A0A8H6YAD1_9AGAR|nr:hypothetical protein MVEN_01134600 [Mycena venus]